MINKDNFIQGLRYKDLKVLDYLVENYSDLGLKVSYSVLNNRQFSKEYTNDVLLVKHSFEKSEKADIKKMTKEESIEYCEKIENRLDNLSKGEYSGVIYTKKITFKDGNEAEIYKVERKYGKILIYVKGNNKKQVFNMLSKLYTSTGILFQSIEDTGVGYIAEFDDISKNRVIIKMTVDILEFIGIYNEDESKITLK